MKLSEFKVGDKVKAVYGGGSFIGTVNKIEENKLYLTKPGGWKYWSCYEENGCVMSDDSLGEPLQLAKTLPEKFNRKGVSFKTDEEAWKIAKILEECGLKWHDEDRPGDGEAEWKEIHINLRNKDFFVNYDDSKDFTAQEFFEEMGEGTITKLDHDKIMEERRKIEQDLVALNTGFSSIYTSSIPITNPKPMDEEKTVLQKIKDAVTPEPQKTLKKHGVLNSSNDLTNEGVHYLNDFLVRKFGAEMKEELDKLDGKKKKKKA